MSDAQVNNDEIVVAARDPLNLGAFFRQAAGALEDGAEAGIDIISAPLRPIFERSVGVTLDLSDITNDFVNGTQTLVNGATDLAGQAVELGTQIVSAAATALGIDNLKATIEAFPTMSDEDRVAARQTLVAGFASLSDADKLAFQAELRETYNAIKEADPSGGTRLLNLTESLGMDSLKVMATGELDVLHTRPGVLQPTAAVSPPPAAAPAATP